MNADCKCNSAEYWGSFYLLLLAYKSLVVGGGGNSEEDLGVCAGDAGWLPAFPGIVGGAGTTLVGAADSAGTLVLVFAKAPTTSDVPARAETGTFNSSPALWKLESESFISFWVWVWGRLQPICKGTDHVGPPGPCRGGEGLDKESESNPAVLLLVKWSWGKWGFPPELRL